jgi:acetyl-CoA synthetase
MTFDKTTTYPFGQQIVWTPNEKWVEESNLTAFRRKEGIESYPKLLEKAENEVEWFWDAVCRDLGIVFHTPYSKIVDLSEGYALPKWCVGARMNIIESCLSRWINEGLGNKLAFAYESEEGSTTKLSFLELEKEVNKCANALRSIGLKKGDVIALFMPMTPELVISFLAIVKIGGILLPLFSGFGSQAIVMRLNDAQAKAFICANGNMRRGKPYDMKGIVDEAVSDSPSVRHVIVADRFPGMKSELREGRDLDWHTLVDCQSPICESEICDAEDPLMLIYTSGTTGKPKGAVHTHCGFPIKAAQDLKHAMDLKVGNSLFWFTDMGWMMGPWEVFGALICGSALVFFDGAPDFPDPGRIWRVVSEHKVTHFGLSPTLIRSLMGHGTEPLRGADFTHLRAVGSTGSPWDPEGWNWLFRNVLDSKKPILNYSGGTEVSGGILCGNFLTPQKPCALSGPVLGMAADVVDESGKSIRNSIGELVVRKPWIGMTRGFWMDKDRYLETYWSRFANVWLHGDYAAVDEDGLWYILGRSDATIKVAGKRVGPAEVEAIVNADEAVIESAAIGVPHPMKDQEIVVFCVLRPGRLPTEELRKHLFETVTSGLGKALKPKAVYFCAQLPKTRNSKIMHRVVKAAHLGEKLGDLTSLENIDALSAIREAH